jgi:hypothetical protein
VERKSSIWQEFEDTDGKMSREKCVSSSSEPTLLLTRERYISTSLGNVEEETASIRVS